MYMQKTLKSLLEDPAIAAIAPDAISKWDLTKEKFYHWTLQEIADKMGWAVLNRGFMSLFAAAEKEHFYHKLYSEDERKADPAKENVNFVYFPSDDPAANDRPFLLLVPGGGFVNVWSLTEGWPVARHFNERGYHVFILTYRVCVEASAVKAMEDIARAMTIIREKKDIFHVNPDRYMTCGFSAGGYIVCLWNTTAGYSAYGMARPEVCFPIYPATSYRLLNNDRWDKSSHKDAFAKAGVGCTMQEACASVYEIPDHVDTFPPTAIFVAAKDELVDPEHSRCLAGALVKAGIPCRLEVGPTGGHGFADGTGMCMEGWPERAMDWFEGLK